MVAITKPSESTAGLAFQAPAAAERAALSVCERTQTGRSTGSPSADLQVVKRLAHDFYEPHKHLPIRL